jgi:hypothetical protein
MSRIIKILATLSLCLATSSLCLAAEVDKCLEIGSTMHKDILTQVNDYEIVQFDQLPEAQKTQVLAKIKSRCISKIKLGNSTFAVLLKSKKNDTYLVVRAAALECEDPSWGVRTIAQFKEFPLITTIDTYKVTTPLVRGAEISQTFIDLSSKKEVIVKNPANALIVEFLDSNNRYLYHYEDKGYVKYRIK